MRPTLIARVRPRRPARDVQPLLPPLSLYRRILRAHRLLPSAQRELGDAYVKHEFKQHKDTDNPLHIVGFLTMWQDYWHQITSGKWAEGSLTQEQLSKMNPDQALQLYLLMKETRHALHGDEEYDPEEDPIINDALKKKI